MFNKLQKDTDVQKSTGIDSLSGKKKEGLNNNNELRAKIDGYQKSPSEKDEIIQQLTEQAVRKKESAEEFQKSLSKKEETVNQDTARNRNLS